MEAKLKSTRASNWGGKSLLKSHYKKSLFTLIKSAKRYYFGSWLIKLPFYAIFNESKAQKYREKRTIRYENLQIAKRQFKRIRKLSPQIKAWVESDEFKEKYANHPYPPLLNPQNIDYELILADLAWEMNLPLPDNYKFIFLATHGVGRAATGSYLLSCSMPYFNEFQTFNNNKERYKAYYNLLLSNEYPYNIITISELRPEQDKFIHLLQKRPFLILVRDPISNLKSLINYPMPNFALKKEFFTLKDRDFQIFGKYLYRKTLDDKTIIEFIGLVLEPFGVDSTYQFIEKAIVIQTNDVVPRNAFETFTQLAKKLHFAPPKESDRVLFETNLVQGMLDMCLPLILRIYPSDCNISSNFEYFDIFISYAIHWRLSRKDKGENFADITDFLNISQDAIVDMCIKIESKYFGILKQDLLLKKDIKKYITNLLLSLKGQNDIYKRYFYAENDILQYLKHSNNCRKKFKTHLDERVEYFKENHPDIVASWKYYNEFEKMCAELDST